MRLTLIHNSGAGRAASLGEDALVALLRDAGHEVRYRRYGAPGWERTLQESADAVVVAGGDGTAGRVAKRLGEAGARALPIALLPGGTANNLARALGVAGRPYEELARGWPKARIVTLDIGEATGPWGRRYVIEGIGTGLFAAAIPEVQASETMEHIPRVDAKVAYTLQLLRERLEGMRPEPVEATLDGEDVSGEYLLFEAMIMPFVGPNLFLSPESRPGDGRFELVLADADARPRLLQYLESWRDEKPRLPVLPTRQGRALSMRWRGGRIHVDDELWPPEDEHRGEAPIELALRDIVACFLVPEARRRI